MRWHHFTHPRVWMTAVVLILGLAVAVPLIYLSGIVNPEKELRDYPVALVVEPQDASPAGVPDFAAKLAAAVREHTDATKISLLDLTHAQAERRFADDDLAGAVVIPADFNAGIAALLSPAPTTRASLPEVQIVTNSGDGSLAAGLVTGNLQPVLTGARTAMGSGLVEAAAQRGPTSAAAAVGLGSPFTITSPPYEELPASSGFGLVPFYITLVALLIGFIGANAVNPIVDSALGIAPSELGPLTMRSPYRHASRVLTFLAKAAIMVVVAPAAAGLLQLVVVGLGIPISAPWQLWLLLSATIAAVGIGALAVFAIVGGPAAIINTIFFIALSMASAGATVPLEAVPPALKWLNAITPMHPVVHGVRGILFFDARWTAGLDLAWTHVGIGAAIGLALGVVVMKLYDASPRFSRAPRPVDAAAQA